MHLNGKGLFVFIANIKFAMLGILPVAPKRTSQRLAPRRDNGRSWAPQRSGQRGGQRGSQRSGPRHDPPGGQQRGGQQRGSKWNGRGRNNGQRGNFSMNRYDYYDAEYDEHYSGDSEC